MLAFLYLIVLFVLGDSVGRRYYPFVSIPHRVASSFLVGLLLSSWLTYLCGYLFASSPTPMFWANALFLLIAAGLIFWLRMNAPKVEPRLRVDFDGEFKRWDWVIAGIFLLFATWMMFRTFAMSDTNINIGHHQFPDFGSTVSIMQSFALGHNFPTQYPHFTGERIRYHFLFYFEAGNLEYLGFSPAFANNILSIFSLWSLLIVVMTLGKVLFRSRIAGRIGAALFFFHGSLAFIPFLRSQPSFEALLDKLNTVTPYLDSGLPYRGEQWGVWSQNVFLNQRHFSSSIAILLLVVVYLIMRYREHYEALPDGDASVIGPTDTENLDAADGDIDDQEELETDGDEDPEDESGDDDEESEDDEDADDEEESDEDESDDEGSDEEDEDEWEEESDEDDGDENPEEEDDDDEDEDEETGVKAADPDGPDLIGTIKANSVFVFSGLLLGLLPLWNGAVFLMAVVVLAMFFLLFKLRRELIVMAVTAAIVSIPQVLYLKTGNTRVVGYSMFNFGFVVDSGSISEVLYYTFFTFGFKWVLLAIALYFANSFQRKVLLAFSILLPLTYFFRFSEEILANHKFLNVWLIVVNVFCGYALIKLWRLKTGSSSIPLRLVAVALALLITIGGAIDLMPIRNSYFIQMKYDDDRLINWVKDNTDKKAIFLTPRYINHQILLAGRKLYYGDPYFAWSVDYDTSAHEVVASQIYDASDPKKSYDLIKENNISYVAIDDTIRRGGTYIRNCNEQFFAKNFELVFTDNANEYSNIRIYKVPDTFTAPASNEPLPDVPAENLFKTGEGNGPGRLSKPRGIAVDSKGSIYVADTANSRVQKFQPDGTFVMAFGENGAGDGMMGEPNGVAVDAAGNIYVTDAKYHKLMKFGPDTKFIKEWKGPKPDSGFYGPRDLAFGPNKKLYIIDQGGTRICVLDPASEEFTTFGIGGNGEGQFNEPTGITIAENQVFVADLGNDRVQVFDLEGKFQRQWPMPMWEHANGNYPDLVYDDLTKRLIISSGKTNELISVDLNGGSPLPVKAEGDNALNNPSSLAVLEQPKQRRLLVLNTGKNNVSSLDIGVKSGK